MAEIVYRYRTVKHGEKCIGKVRLSCGGEIEEFAVARTNEKAQEACARLIARRIVYHIENCSEKH